MKPFKIVSSPTHPLKNLEMVVMPRVLPSDETAFQVHSAVSCCHKVASPAQLPYPCKAICRYRYLYFRCDINYNMNGDSGLLVRGEPSILAFKFYVLFQNKSNIETYPKLLTKLLERGIFCEYRIYNLAPSNSTFCQDNCALC